MNILGNNHLQLRPLTRENAIELRFIAMAMNDKGLQDYLTDKINNPVKNDLYGVFYKKRAKSLIIGYLELEPSARAYNVSGFIAPNYRRNHYMTNVLETVVQKFTATVFYFNIDLKNTAAQLMLEKFGATVLDTSLEKKVYYIKGNPHM